MRSSLRALLAAVAWFFFGAVATAQTPTPLHAYELNNSLADTFGGPTLVNNGASLGATGLTFDLNQGPSLSSWLGGSATSGNYSIEMRFYLTNATGGYRKLIDFKNLTADAGLYDAGTALGFYPVVTGPVGVIEPSDMVHLVLTRDAATNTVVGYINGNAALGISFTDSSGLGTFTGPNNIIQFFQDDTVTSQTEASPGFVDFIRIYDHALTSQDAAALYLATVPEPAAFALTGVAAAAGVMLAVRRYRRRQAEALSPQR